MKPLVLKNKICLIAGTTGIGGASARLFGREGAKIVAVGRSPENAAALARQLTEAGVENFIITEDLSKAGACDRVFNAALERFGQLDVLSMWRASVDASLATARWQNARMRDGTPS